MTAQWDATDCDTLDGPVIGGSAFDATVADALLPGDLAVTIGRRDSGWTASPAAWVLRVPLTGDARLFYAPDVAAAETWVYRWSPDPDSAYGGLAAVVDAGGLSGPVDTRPAGSMVSAPLWGQTRAGGVDRWLMLDAAHGWELERAVSVVEALVPVDIWARVVHRRSFWQSERDRAQWRRAQRQAEHVVSRLARGRS